MDILIVETGGNEKKAVIGFTNSNGEIEYNLYHKIDGGVIGDPDSDIGAILATEVDMDMYEDFSLTRID